eukprot:256165_1
MTNIYYTYIYTLTYGFAAICLCPVIYVFSISYFNGVLKTIKSLFYASLILYLMVFTDCTLFALWSVTKCHHVQISLIIHNIALQLYVIQIIVLGIILFYRLYTLFKSTPFQLSKLVTRFYLSLILIVSFLGIFAAVMYSNYLSIARFVSSLIGIFGMILMISIICLYIYKLFLVYKTGNDDDLMNVITKTSLLTFISILNTILVFITLPLFSFEKIQYSPHCNYAWNLIVIADLYTNVFCIFLGFKHFKQHYIKVCGFCDVKCNRICTKYVENNIRVAKEINIKNGTTNVVNAQSSKNPV